MAAFSTSESPEEFKHRLNSLAEKLNNTVKNSNQASTSWKDQKPLDKSAKDSSK
jgi:hypothetical protein